MFVDSCEVCQKKLLYIAECQKTRLLFQLLVGTSRNTVRNQLTRKGQTIKTSMAVRSFAFIMVVLVVFSSVACNGYSVAKTIKSRISHHQKYGNKKFNAVLHSDLDLSENSDDLKRKADTLKDESERLVKSVVNEPLPHMLSLEFQATIDKLKSAIALNNKKSVVSESSSLSGKLDIQAKKNWLLSDLTENGSPTLASSGSARLDLFFQVTEHSERDLVRERLDASWAENSLDTLQIIAQLRDIRSGKGDKSSAYYAVEWLLENHPLTCIENLKNLVDVGYWKDILNMLRWKCLGKRWAESDEPRGASKTSNLMEAAILRRQGRIDANLHAREAFAADPLYRLLHLSVAALFAGELKKDLALLSSLPSNESFSSLAGKWAPSPQGNHDKATLIASTIAELIFPRDSIASKASKAGGGAEELMTYKEYIDIARMQYQTQVLSPLRRQSAVTEVFMSARQWHVLPYNRVSSLCMKKNVRRFTKHDQLRFDKFILDVQLGKKKRLASGAVKPHELLEVALKSKEDAVEFKVNELQWQSYVESLRSKGSLSNCLAVCDVSGSMSTMNGLPLRVAVSLSLLVAELAQPPYNNIVCTFSSKPYMHEVEPGTLRERYNGLVRADWSMSTDFNAVFSLILARAQAARLPPEEMIRTVFVFSDMEFDEAQRSNYYHPNPTNFEAAKSEFESQGYSLPRLVFWNLRGDTRSTGRGASVPVRADEADVALVSGFSGQMLANFLDGQLLDPAVQEEEEEEEEEEDNKDSDEEEELLGADKVKLTPFETMVGIIKSGKYDQWVVVD